MCFVCGKGGVWVVCQRWCMVCDVCDKGGVWFVSQRRYAMCDVCDKGGVWVVSQRWCMVCDVCDKGGVRHKRRRQPYRWYQHSSLVSPADAEAVGGDGRPAAAQHPPQPASELREVDAGAVASGSSADGRTERGSRQSD